MDGYNVWNFVLGIVIGIIIGCLVAFFGMDLKTKFCPTCGSVYKDAVNYCEYDGTLLKERGN